MSKKMSEKDFENLLIEAIFSMSEVTNAVSFEDKGILSSDAGVVVKLEDGSVFQLTIVEDDR